MYAIILNLASDIAVIVDIMSDMVHYRCHTDT